MNFLEKKSMKANRISSIIQFDEVADAIFLLAQRVHRKAYFEFYGKSVRSMTEIESDLIMVGCNGLRQAICRYYPNINEEEMAYLEHLTIYLAIQQSNKMIEDEEIRKVITEKILKSGVPELRIDIH